MLKTFYSCLNYQSSVFVVCFNCLKSLNSHAFVYNLAFKLLAIFFVHTHAQTFSAVLSVYRSINIYFLVCIFHYAAQYYIIGENWQKCSSWFSGIKVIKPSYGKCYLTWLRSHLAQGDNISTNCDGSFLIQTQIGFCWTHSLIFMYYLKHEQQCFIRYKHTRRNRVSLGLIKHALRMF